jgi:hypothetical protein
VIAGGAAAALLLGDVVIPASPVFFPPPVRTGPLAMPAQWLVAAVVGSALISPIAVAVAVGVDAIAWLGFAHPLSLRGIVAAVAAGVLAVVITLPTLVVTCVLMTLVTLAARRDADRLLLHRERQLVVAALGWGLPIVFLGPALALAGAALRGVTLAVLVTE